MLFWNFLIFKFYFNLFKLIVLSSIEFIEEMIGRLRLIEREKFYEL